MTRKAKSGPLRAQKGRAAAAKLYRHVVSMDTVDAEFVAGLKSYGVVSDERPIGVTSWFEDPQGKCVIRKIVARYPDGETMTMTRSPRGVVNIKLSLTVTIKGKGA